MIVRKKLKGVQFFICLIKKKAKITWNSISIPYSAKSNKCYQLMMTYIFKLPERHKLDNVSHGGFACQRAQTSIVSVQELHRCEVCVAYSNDDDGHGQSGGIDDGTACLIHVCYHSVGDDEEDKVLLQEDSRLMMKQLFARFLKDPKASYMVV